MVTDMRKLRNYFTSTVGLISVRYEAGVNIMAAEWTYLVSKEPPYIAVVLADGGLTQQLIPQVGEFAVTICTSDQAALADFVGSFSGREIHKTSTPLLSFHEPEVLSTPWVEGGIISLECALHQVVSLPGYRMMIGEIVGFHINEEKNDSPLIKHGAMYQLGAKIPINTVVTSVELCAGNPPRLKVAATGTQTAKGEAPFRIRLVDPEGTIVPICESTPNHYGDLLGEYDLPESVIGWDLAVCQVLVEREGAKPGWANITVHNM